MSGSCPIPSSASSSSGNLRYQPDLRHPRTPSNTLFDRSRRGKLTPLPCREPRARRGGELLMRSRLWVQLGALIAVPVVAMFGGCGGDDTQNATASTTTTGGG